MTKIKLSIFELVLRETLIGKQFYDNDDNLKTIDDINYQPLLDVVYVKSGEDGYYFLMNEMYDFELDFSARPQILPNKGRIRK